MKLFYYKNPIYKIIIATLFGVAIFSGCGESVAKQSSPVSVYLLTSSQEDSFFKKIDNFDRIATLAPTPILKPWSLSVRITDIAMLESGKVIAIVNKKGVVDVDSLLTDEYETISHESFKYCSAGEIVEQSDGTFLCRIYKDSFFSDEKSFSTLPSPFVEINQESRSAKYSANYYPDQIEGFFLTGIYKKNEKWFSSWKRSKNEKTDFIFFSQNLPDGTGAVEITEKEFLSVAMDETVLVDNQEMITFLEKAVINLLKTDKNEDIHETVIDVDLRSGRGQAERINYTFRIESNTEYEKICVVFPAFDSEDLILDADRVEQVYLTYKGDIYFSERKEDKEMIELFKLDKCSLPEGYNYTFLVEKEGKLYAAWEKQLFFNTGSAGLSIIEHLRLDKIAQ